MRERILFLFHSKQKQCFQILKTTEKLFNRFNKGFCLLRYDDDDS